MRFIQRTTGSRTAETFYHFVRVAFQLVHEFSLFSPEQMAITKRSDRRCVIRIRTQFKQYSHSNFVHRTHLHARAQNHHSCPFFRLICLLLRNTAVPWNVYVGTYIDGSRYIYLEYLHSDKEIRTKSLIFTTKTGMFVIYIPSSESYRIDNDYKMTSWRQILWIIFICSVSSVPVAYGEPLTYVNRTACKLFAGALIGDRTFKIVRATRPGPVGNIANPIDRKSNDEDAPRIE